MNTFLTALAVAGIGLFGAWLGARWEHRRWLTDKRLETYVDLLAHTSRLYVKVGAPAPPQEQLLNTIARVRLVAGRRVEPHAARYVRAAGKWSIDPEALGDTEERFVEAVRDELGLR